MAHRSWMATLAVLATVGCGAHNKKNSGDGGDADGKRPGGADLSPIAGQKNTLDAKGLAAAVDELIAAERTYHATLVPGVPCDASVATEEILANPTLALMETAGVSQLGETGAKTVTPPEASSEAVVRVDENPGEQFAVGWEWELHTTAADEAFSLVDERKFGGNEQVVYGLIVVDATYDDDVRGKNYDLFVFDRKTKLLKTFHTGVTAIDPAFQCEDFGESRCATKSRSTVDLAKGSLTFAMEIMDADEEKHTGHDYEFQGAFQGNGTKVTGDYEAFFGANLAPALGASTNGKVPHEFTVGESLLGACF